MPNVTFTSQLHKDKTVYAVAGSHKKTILELAKENHIPIDFSCGDGECGTCLVRVTHLDKTKKMGHPLTDREVTVLKDLGKITKAQIEEMRVTDLVTTPWRLACQMVLDDDDIIVEYPSK
jgi:ferredoxin